MLKVYKTQEPEKVFLCIHAKNKKNDRQWDVKSNFIKKWDDYLNKKLCPLCITGVPEDGKLFCKYCNGRHFLFKSHDPYYLDAMCQHCKIEVTIFNEKKSEELKGIYAKLKIHIPPNEADFCYPFYEFEKSWKYILSFKNHYEEKQLSEWLNVFY